ncbi:hypothetical protein DPEC_G00362880 [Dallia pectoralis]|nr:hypothetical protein DPEC_G00362880 [Dallia pectoralis]
MIQQKGLHYGCPQWEPDPSDPCQCPDCQDGPGLDPLISGLVQRGTPRQVQLLGPALCGLLLLLTGGDYKAAGQVWWGDQTSILGWTFWHVMGELAVGCMDD